MKTTTIPFELETAMKIQAGEIKGAIKTKEGMKARILCTDVQDVYPIVAAITGSMGEQVLTFKNNGSYHAVISDPRDLVLEVPEDEPKPQFKPYQKVLVRDYDECEWHADFYSHYTKGGVYRCVSYAWNQCVPYEGNEHLLGTTDKPKED